MRSSSWRSKQTPGNGVAEFEYCLRCGQPLRSWWSRREGFGFDCREALSHPERRQLVQAAEALESDLDALDQAGARLGLSARIRLLGIALRGRV